MQYQINVARIRQALKNTEPTLTDQSQANDTDINIVMKNFMGSKIVNARPGQPIGGDFTQIQGDLRHQLEILDKLRARLPRALAELPTDQLLGLTEDQLRTILTPPEKPADKPADKPAKEDK